MSLPSKVQQQIEEAERIEAAMGQQGTPVETPPAPPAEPPTEPPAEPPAPPAEPPKNDIGKPQPAPQVDEKVWEQRYRTLHGMYNAEVPQLHDQIRQLKATIEQLREAQSASVQAPTQAPQPALVTDEDKEAFGQDLIDLADRIAKQNMAPLVAERNELVQKVRQLEAQLGHVGEQVTMSAEEKFFARLNEMEPQWERLNTDSGFLAWLAEVDPLYGIPRQAALNNAVEKKDAARAANIFSTYISLITPPAPPTARKPQTNDLQSQVAPTRSRVAPVPTQTTDNKKVWRQTEVSKFYQDVRTGLITGDEAARIEREIDLAAAEGRIVN